MKHGSEKQISDSNANSLFRYKQMSPLETI